MRVPSFVVLVLSTGLACSPVASGDDEAGVTTNHGSGDTGTGTTGTSTGTTGTSTGTTGTSDGPSESSSAGDDPMKLDLPFMSDLMQVDECTTTWLTWDDLKVSYPDCMIVPDGGASCWTEPMIGCTPPGPNGCLCPQGDCIGNWSVCTGDIVSWGETVPLEVCGPFVLDGLCCSIGEFTFGCAE